MRERVLREQRRFRASVKEIHNVQDMNGHLFPEREAEMKTFSAAMLIGAVSIQIPKESQFRFLDCFWPFSGIDSGIVCQKNHKMNQK